MRTISEKAMQIIKKGGCIRKDEIDFLSKNMPSEYCYKNIDDKIQRILNIYLHEVRGYCFVACDEYDIYRYDNNSQKAYPVFMLLYEDVEHKRIFDEYDDLKKYSSSNKIMEKEPLDNDEFQSILDYGEVNGWRDMMNFIKFKNYVLYDHKRERYVAVFVKKNGSRIYLPVQYEYSNEVGYPTEKIDYDHKARIFFGNGKGGFMLAGEIIEDYLDDYIFENSNIIN